MKAVLMTVSLFCATVWMLWRLFLMSHYMDMLPLELEIAGTVAVHEDFTPYSLEGCGVAVFRMSRAQKARLTSQGMEALKDAMQARGNKGPRYRYSQWTATPVPALWVREGTWIMCPDIGRRLHQSIVDAATREGSFFTTLPEGELMVIPELELIVFSSNG